ncbi:G-protein coupled receptor 143-like [Lytechinus pictus]|uniref:G-protein coupled receptor 143-like n=1 Tax=Lytechinus pictus TaxID=7653 RepID=UPI0030B9DF40
MASPTLDLLCCSFFGIANETNISNTEPVENYNMTVLVPVDNKYLSRIKTYFYLYNSTVVVMSAISVLGSLYMLFPRKRYTTNLDSAIRPGLMEIRQKWILFWLSFADIMACLGLIVLASESLHILVVSDKSLTNKLTSKTWKWLCTLATAWIHFFFFATYVWITCYAIDVFLFLQKKTWKHALRFYFVISWLLPIAFLSFGLWALHRTTEPEWACSAKKGDELLLEAYYLCLFVPMVIVLILNPIIYILAVRKVSPLMRRGGMYRDQEREVERQVKRKFLKIVIVLEICWLPNVVNGILLLSRVKPDMKGFPFIWILMAIFNPMQAFLNTLVYWGPTGCSFLSFSPRRSESDDYVSPSEILHSHPPWKDAAVPSDTETTPLMRGRARDALN